MRRGAGEPAAARRAAVITAATATAQFMRPPLGQVGRPEQRRQGVLLVVHLRDVELEPGAEHDRLVVVVTDIVGTGLAIDQHATDAPRPIDERLTDVGQRRRRRSDRLPVRQRLADRAEPGAERLATARPIREQAVRALRLVADLQALQPGLATDVREVLVGQLPVRPRRHHGEPVRRPVVGNVGLEPLDLAPLGGDVVRDALGGVVVAGRPETPDGAASTPRTSRR